MVFRIEDKYRLELYWSTVNYDMEGVAKLNGAYFKGPVLREVAQLEQQDIMNLDFKDQYIFMVPFYYVAVLSWQGVNQTVEKISLSNVILKNKYLNSVPKLNDDDHILIDTKNHEDDKHQCYLSYPSYLIKFDGDVHNFRG